MKGLIEKVKNYSYTERIERLIRISVAQEFNKATPTDLVEMEMIQAIRTANGEIDAVKKMRDITDKEDDIEDNKQHEREPKHFEDDGAYAD